MGIYLRNDVLDSALNSITLNATYYEQLLSKVNRAIITLLEEGQIRESQGSHVTYANLDDLMRFQSKLELRLQALDMQDAGGMANRVEFTDPS